MDWKRYAVYWLPDRELGRAGAAWLGWDARTGVPVPRGDPAAEGPRRYGFHATLKAPFRLRGTEKDLLNECAALAMCLSRLPPQMLSVEDIGGFLALKPGDEGPSRILAARLVEGLDRFRAPPDPAELTRRRASGLSPAQDDLLVRWGYPYVMAEHRLHLTLTGALPPDGTASRIRTHFAAALAIPAPITAIALMGEDAEGRFHLIREMPLQG
ncbi:MAG: DUF1045 domain-containing protein [Jannaschia sp.]